MGPSKGSKLRITPQQAYCVCPTAQVHSLASRPMRRASTSTGGIAIFKMVFIGLDGDKNEVGRSPLSHHCQAFVWSLCFFCLQQILG